MKTWNSLNNTIRNVDTLSKFKSELKKIDETANHAVPKHYYYGPRKLNIISTQLRSSASFLNYDLFRVEIASDPSFINLKITFLKEDSFICSICNTFNSFFLEQTNTNNNKISEIRQLPHHHHMK
jgi:hypothetical protein